jgi:hypothetical protein
MRLGPYIGIVLQVDSLVRPSVGKSGGAECLSVSSDAFALSLLFGVNVVPVVCPNESSGDEDFSNLVGKEHFITLLPSGIVDMC